MQIAISEIADQLDKNATIENRLKHAMKLALNHWLIIDEDEQFRSELVQFYLQLPKRRKQ